MTILGLDPEERIIVIIILIILGFGLVARIDFVVGEREYLQDQPIRLPWLTVGQHWFWMWCVGYPAFAFFVLVIYLLAAPATDRNMWYGLGLFATVLLFAVGQLEDFMWHIVNYFDGVRFPAGDWSGWGWSAENSICWRLFGTWNSFLHIIWLAIFMIIVVGMWYCIFEVCE